MPTLFLATVTIVPIGTFKVAKSAYIETCNDDLVLSLYPSSHQLIVVQYSAVSNLAPSKKVNIFAVPVPVPLPVAVKVIPAVLDAAPIKVKSVFPNISIIYSLPILKLPAVIVAYISGFFMFKNLEFLVSSIGNCANIVLAYCK